MTRTEESRRALARLVRDDPIYAGRRRVLALLAIIAVVLAVGLAWRALDEPSVEEVDMAGLQQQALLWYLGRRQDTLMAPSSDDTAVAFVIEPGESLSSIAQRLEDERLLRSASSFELLARARGLDREVQAGEHELRRNMTAGEVLDSLLVAAGPEVGVTVPEGLRAEEVVDILVAAGVAEREPLQALVVGGVTGGGAFPVIPAGDSLEGYLFPDTYQLAPNAGAHRAIGAMLDGFAARFTPEMRERATASGLTIHEVVTLASIVEREAVRPEERATIARVFLNRLATPPYLLNADPSVQYALGYDEGSSTWWKRWLTAEDLQIDSPYNTYVHPGLPPGPISNPGLASLEAVLAPADGDWMYFVANDVACDGSHAFATTWDEHLSNVSAYRNEDCRAAP